MDYNNHNTSLRTNKHLNLEERFYLEKRIALGATIHSIATELGRSRTTIYTELKRGTVVQIKHVLCIWLIEVKLNTRSLEKDHLPLSK